jgi:hypothetical protein
LQPLGSIKAPSFVVCSDYQWCLDGARFFGEMANRMTKNDRAIRAALRR